MWTWHVSVSLAWARQARLGESIVFSSLFSAAISHESKPTYQSLSCVYNITLTIESKNDSGTNKNRDIRVSPSFPYLEIARRIPRLLASDYDGPRRRFTNWKKPEQVQNGLLG